MGVHIGGHQYRLPSQRGAIISNRKMKTLTLLLFVICLSGLGISQITQPKVQWFDDFLGIKPNPAYAISKSDSATVEIASDTGGNGGMILLSVFGYASGAARLRLGEDPVTGGINSLSFSARKNLVYQTRVFLNGDTDVCATIGFIGYSDPNNVIAAIYGVGNTWRFEVTNDGQREFVDTGFRHKPGCWFTVKIVTEWGEIPKAKIYFDDDTAPAAEVGGNYVPPSGICPEFQLWNRKTEEAYSQPTMWIDYLSISQDR